jgi:putative ABC transport system ATP-binding protein
MQPPKLSGNPAVIATQLGKTVTTTQKSLTILSAINFSINAIVGEPGSGKSTLPGLLAGLDTPTTGSVVLADHDLTWLQSEQVGFLFQSFQLLPGMTVMANAMLPLEAYDYPQLIPQCPADGGFGGLQRRFGHAGSRARWF